MRQHRPHNAILDQHQLCVRAACCLKCGVVLTWVRQQMVRLVQTRGLQHQVAAPLCAHAAVVVRVSVGMNVGAGALTGAPYICTCVYLRTTYVCIHGALAHTQTRTCGQERQSRGGRASRAHGALPTTYATSPAAAASVGEGTHADSASGHTLTKSRHRRDTLSVAICAQRPVHAPPTKTTHLPTATPRVASAACACSKVSAANSASGSRGTSSWPRDILQAAVWVRLRGTRMTPDDSGAPPATCLPELAEEDGTCVPIGWQACGEAVSHWLLRSRDTSSCPP